MDVTSLIETEAAYLAAIIDGEGTMGLYKDKRQLRPHASLSVTNTSWSLIEWLATKIEGTTSKYSQRRPNDKDRWQFVVTGKASILRVLQLTMPYLVIKRRQAELLIEFLRFPLKNPINVHQKGHEGVIGRVAVPPPQRVWEIMDEIKILNKRGC